MGEAIVKNLRGSSPGLGIHVEFWLGEGSTGRISETLMMLFPLASSRDRMNCEPAANDNGLRAIPLEKSGSCRGTTIVVALKGMIFREDGVPETGIVNPE
jgi:hypothetical protein